MKRLFTILLLGAILFALKPVSANADCSALYGGGETCTENFTFDVQKSVLKPGKGSTTYAVGGLSINDPKYSPSQNVTFQITVKNTGNKTIPTIRVVDTFPQFISYVSGPGNFDTNNKTLTYTVSNLEAGKSVTHTIIGKIADSNMMPSDQGVICLINYAKGTDNNGKEDNAQAQFCVQKSVLGSTPQVLSTPKVVTTPATGPEMLPLLALLPGGLGGLILRRKSNRMNKGGEK